jgi:uncharacterized protein
MQFELYKDISKYWRWRLRDDDHHVIAASGDGYKRKSDCLTVLNRIKADAARAEVIQMSGDNPTGELSMNIKQDRKGG